MTVHTHVVLDQDLLVVQLCTAKSHIALDIPTVHGIEITVIKVTICENCTVLGIYHSPKIPIRQLCQAVSEVSDTISTENNIIIGDLNVNWLIEADRQSLWNLLVSDKCYKQLI